MDKKELLFVNDEMTMGGVARILNTLLFYIDKEKYNIDLLILHKRGELLNEIPSDVRVIEGTDFFNTIDIPLKECTLKNIWSKIRLVFYMKTGLIRNRILKERNKILNKHYDVEFCAKEGFCTLFTSCGDSKRKINWVQTDYKIHNYSKNHMGLIKDALNYIDINIACSEQVKESFKEVFSISNIVVIKNPIEEDRIRELSLVKVDNQYDENKINLIVVARFHEQKRLDRVINAFAKLKDYYTLTIIGDGDLKDKLYLQAKQSNVFDNIKWLGILDNPYGYIRNSDLFVMSSGYEGYPTITIETLISQTPILSTEVAGIKEQLTEKHYGFIVDNNDNSIYEKLEELKDKKQIIIEYKNKLANYHYNNEQILKEIEELF